MKGHCIYAIEDGEIIYYLSARSNVKEITVVDEAKNTVKVEMKDGDYYIIQNPKLIYYKKVEGDKIG